MSAAPSVNEDSTGRFRILQTLDQGGMGVVYVALARGPEGFKKLVVLKTMRPELLGDETARKMFLHEARISARLNHVNVVQVFEVIEWRGSPTIVMECLEGASLSDVLRSAEGAFPRALYLQTLCSTLAGLHAAHELLDFDGQPLGLVHRDVSPHNVFLLFDGTVKVLDFGIAKTASSEVETQTGILKGKLRYMAPEQLMGEEPDRRADIFAVGVMLYEAIYGRRFWGDLPDREIMRRLLTLELPLFSDPKEVTRANGSQDAADEVRAQLEAVCLRAVAPDPKERFGTAEEFRLALEPIRAQTTREEESLARFLSEHFGAKQKKWRQSIDDQMRAVSDLPPEPEKEGPLVSDQLEAASTTRPVLTALGLFALAAVIALVAWLAPPGARGPSPAATDSTSAGDPGPAVSVPARECGRHAKWCDDSCVSIDLPETGCESENCAPCQVDNATPRCSAAHECDIAVCYQGYSNCDGDRSNGCEVDTRIDPDHCGACGNRCPELPHAERGCGNECKIWRCERGFRDCNGEVEDGCEQPVGSDRENCGQCGVVCPQGSSCRGGRCQP